MTTWQIVDKGILKIVSDTMVARLERSDFQSASLPYGSVVFVRRDGSQFTLSESGQPVNRGELLSLLEQWFDGWDPKAPVGSLKADPKEGTPRCEP